MKRSKYRAAGNALVSLCAIGTSFFVAAMTFAAPNAEPNSPSPQAAATEMKNSLPVKTKTGEAKAKNEQKVLLGTSENPRATGLNSPKPPTPPKDELIAKSKLKTTVAPGKAQKRVVPANSVGNRATGLNSPKPPTPPKDELLPMRK